jgi:hypothetical protein
VAQQQVEHLAAVADAEREPHVRMRLRERAHERGHEGLGGRRHGRDPQHALVDLRRLARLAPAGLEQPDDVGRVRGEGAAGRRRSHAAPGALEQRRADLVRERGDRRRHGRLGDHELIRGRRDRAAADDGQEAAQLRESNRHLSIGQTEI